MESSEYVDYHLVLFFGVVFLVIGVLCFFRLDKKFGINAVPAFEGYPRLSALVPMAFGIAAIVVGLRSYTPQQKIELFSKFFHLDSSQVKAIELVTGETNTTIPDSKSISSICGALSQAKGYSPSHLGRPDKEMEMFISLPDAKQRYVIGWYEKVGVLVDMDIEGQLYGPYKCDALGPVVLGKFSEGTESAKND